MKEIEKKIRGICKSLYKTGYNDGKNKITYFPNPIEFRVKELLALFSQSRQELIEKVIGEDEKVVKGHIFEMYDEDGTAGQIDCNTERIRNRNELRKEQRQRYLAISKIKEKTK